MIQPQAISYSIMGARHTQNDDASVINQEQGIYIVCDGVSEGGHGNLASDLVTKNLQEKLTEANQFIKKNGAQLLGPKRLQTLQDLLLNAFSETQQNLQKAAAMNANFKLAATTCIALWMDGRFAIMAHIGDTRAYLYRAGKLYQLTKDHSGLDELLKMGIPLEVATKNPMSRSLTRAFGNARYTHPDLLKIEFQPNDFLFICTDGMYTALQQQGLQQFVTAVLQGKEPKPFVELCARQSGDDATMIQIQFPQQSVQENGQLLQASDRIKLIQQTPLSKYFDYIQKSHIAAICEIEEYKKGSVVVQEGTDGESMYIVAKGTLEVLVKGQHITYKKAGEFFGEISLVRQVKRSATVIAKEDTILLSLKRNDLFDVFKKDAEIERLFYKAMLEMMMDRMVEQGHEIASLRGA
jgi:serine/threonine protein phosphatase PrpC